MRMLEVGVDVTTTAPWLGRESTQTTQMFRHADLALKGTMAKLPDLQQRGSIGIVPKSGNCAIPASESRLKLSQPC